jgi:hypothetical protein
MLWVVLLLVAVVIFFVIRSKEDVKNKQLQNKNDVEEFKSGIRTDGFIVSKLIECPATSLVFAVDTVNKKWIARDYAKSYRSITFSQILSFDISESGGSLALNTLNSIVLKNSSAFAGEKYLQGTCDNLQLNIRVNEIECPVVSLHFTPPGVPIVKDARFFSLLGKVQEIAAAVEYMMNNTKPEASELGIGQ